VHVVGWMLLTSSFFCVLVCKGKVAHTAGASLAPRSGWQNRRFEEVLHYHSSLLNATANPLAQASAVHTPRL
jgi:hypothetical protein